jgi:hypothetical protein
MFNRVSRRERRRRLYFLRAMIARMRDVAGDPDYDLAAAFDIDPRTLRRWLEAREPVPAWVVAIAVRAYRIPEPLQRSRTPLVVAILATIGAGVLVSLGLAWHWWPF